MIPFDPLFYQHTARITPPGHAKTIDGGNVPHDPGTSFTIAADFQIPDRLLQADVLVTSDDRIGSVIHGGVDFPTDPGITGPDWEVVWLDRPWITPFRSLGPAISQDQTDDGTPVNYRLSVRTVK